MKNAPQDGRATLAREHGAGRQTLQGAALWATIGFVSGAVLWHGAGLRDFVSDVVMKPVLSGHASRAGDPIETGSLPSIHIVDPASCTSLELDRQANRTIVRACPRDGLALRLDAGNDRGDLAALAD